MIEEFCLVLKDALWCLPFSQAGQGLSFENTSDGKPRTLFCLARLFMFLKFRWESLLCQSQLRVSVALAKRHVPF